MTVLRAWWHGLTHFHRIAMDVWEFDLYPGERQRWRHRYCFDCGKEFSRERIA